MIRAGSSQIRADDLALRQQHARFAAFDLDDITLQQAITRPVVARQRVENDADIRVVCVHPIDVAPVARGRWFDDPLTATRDDLVQPTRVAARVRVRVMLRERAEHQRIFRVMHQQRRGLTTKRRGSSANSSCMRSRNVPRAEAERPDQVVRIERRIVGRDTNARRSCTHRRDRRASRTNRRRTTRRADAMVVVARLAVGTRQKADARHRCVPDGPARTRPPDWSRSSTC